MGDILYNVADRLLDVAVDVLDDPPAYRVVLDGDPSNFINCPAIAVSMLRNGLYHSAHRQARSQQSPQNATYKTNKRMAQFGVWHFVTNCYPDFSGEVMPTAADVNAATLAVLTDRMDLWNGLRLATYDKTDPNWPLFDGILDHGSDGVEISPATTAVGPSGQVAGTLVSVTVDLLALPEGS